MPFGPQESRDVFFSACVLLETPLLTWMASQGSAQIVPARTIKKYSKSHISIEKCMLGRTSVNIHFQQLRRHRPPSALRHQRTLQGFLGLLPEISVLLPLTNFLISDKGCSAVLQWSRDIKASFSNGTISLASTSPLVHSWFPCPPGPDCYAS